MWDGGVTCRSLESEIVALVLVSGSSIASGFVSKAFDFFDTSAEFACFRAFVPEFLHRSCCRIILWCNRNSEVGSSGSPLLRILIV